MEENEKNFKIFFETITDIVFVCNKQGSIMYANHAAQKMLGYSADELLSKTLFDLHPPKIRQHILQLINEMFDMLSTAMHCSETYVYTKLKEKKALGPLTLMSKNGFMMPVQTRMWLGTWNGNDCLYSVSNDLTKESELFYKYNPLFESNPSSIFVTELPDHVINDVNNAFLATTGYTREEVIGRTPDDLGLFYITIEQKKLNSLIKEQGRADNFEVKIKAKDWRIVDGLISGEVIEQNGKKYFMSVMTEITKQKDLEKTLAERDQLLSKLSEQTPGAIFQFMMRPDGTSCFPYASEGMERVYELTPEDVMFDAKPVFSRIYQQDYDRVMASIRHSFKNTSIWDEQYRVVLPEKGLRWIKGTASPDRLFDGSVLWHGYFCDIHEHKLAEESLRENEEKYRFLVENSHDIIYTLNAEGIFDFVSPSWSLLLGHKTDQVIGHSFVPFVHPDDVPAFLKFLERVISTGKPHDGVEYRIMHAGGEWFWHTSSATPLKNDEGKTIGFVGIAKDITRLKTAETEIEQTSQELDQFFYVNLDLMCILDMDDNFIKISKSWQDVFGYTKQHLENKKYMDFVHPDDIPKTFESMLKLKDQSKALSFVNRYRDKDGQYKYVEWCMHPNGTRIYTAARDITKRMELEANLHNQKQQFELAISASNDGVWDWNLITNEIYFSPRWKQQLGYADEEISNAFSSFEALLHKTDKQKVISKINQYLREDIGLYDIEFRMQHKDGDYRWIWARGEAIRDSSGKAIRIAGSHTDITESKEKQHQIEYLSFFDQLTGLYNRRFFETELKRLDTTRNLPLSLLMVDVNGLKLTNDAFGNAVGDELLKRTSDIIKSVSRDDDIVSRIGADEFVFILTNTNELQARALIKRIKEAAAKRKVANVTVSLACGIGTKTNAQKRISDVFKIAEDDMQRDKISVRSNQRNEMIKIIFRTLFEKAPAEEQHSSQVSRICERIGVSMGLTQNELKNLVTSAALHDIGKISINLAVLDKNGPLDESEWQEVKRHPEAGCNILKSVEVYAPLADIVLSHHERWDGSGYPNGLKGEDIPFQSRIIAVADAFDAMTKERPYKKIMSKQEAIAELKNCAGTQFDPRIVHVFIEKVLNVTDNA